MTMIHLQMARGSAPVPRFVRRLLDNFDDDDDDDAMAVDDDVPETPPSNATPDATPDVVGSTSCTQAVNEPNKVEVYLYGDALRSTSPPKMAISLRQIIETRVHILGHTYATLPSDHKERYWKEFKRRFYWDESVYPTSVIYRCYEMAIKRRYSSRTNEWRQQWAATKTKPTCIPQNCWDAWMKVWDTEEFKEKSAKYSANRLSEPNGPGTGISKHIGGSKSTIDIALDIKKKTGRDATMFEIFNCLHQKPDGSFTTKKAENTAMEVEKTVEEIRSSTQKDPDIDEVYMTIVQPKRKNSIFGTGCFGLASTQNAGSSSASELVHERQLRKEMELKIQRLEQSQADMKAEMKAEMKEEMKEEMKAEMQLRWLCY